MIDDFLMWLAFYIFLAIAATFQPWWEMDQYFGKWVDDCWRKFKS